MYNIIHTKQQDRQWKSTTYLFSDQVGEYELYKLYVS